MASISAFSLSRPASPFSPSSPSSHTSSAFNTLQLQFPCIKFQTQFKNFAVPPLVKLNKQGYLKVRAVAEEESVAPAEETSSPDDATVSVAVSPSDVLTMFFQAEGTMADAAVPNVTKALEEVEGIADLKVKVLEGIASVELTKETTVQSTGVASNLVEIIQGSGFKLQTLNLSFQDEEDLS